MVKNSKKVKKPLSKGKKIALVIFLSILGLNLAAVAVVLIMFGPAGYKLLYMQKDTGYTRVETSLTVEQRLKDFDYMYKYACAENPDLKLFEKAYGISYDELYHRYRGYIENARDDFEFLS